MLLLHASQPSACTHDLLPLQSHGALLSNISALAQRVQDDAGLAALIRRKFSIKCTTGYSLNALVDFPADEPVEIVKRLMIGSEGTLGFVSQATYNTVPEWPHKVREHVWSGCRVFRGLSCGLLQPAHSGMQAGQATSSAD